MASDEGPMMTTSSAQQGGPLQDAVVLSSDTTRTSHARPGTHDSSLHPVVSVDNTGPPAQAPVPQSSNFSILLSAGDIPGSAVPRDEIDQQGPESDSNNDSWDTLESPDNDDDEGDDDDEKDCPLETQEKHSRGSSSPSKNDTLEAQGGCSHYKRHCKIVSPCCEEVFWCRHCHNDVSNTAKEGQDLTTLHEIDRFKITEIVCGFCDRRQPVGPSCTECKKSFARYFCAVCRFWDDDGEKKQIFHCEACGICRVGGRKNFFHCPTCDCCYPVELENNHACVEKAMHTPCPVCLENMFSSIRRVIQLVCGHTIHDECLKKLTRGCRGLSSIRCPLCLKSLTKDNWLTQCLDAAIAEARMPPDQIRNVQITCHDCLRKSSATFHVYGLKCGHCGSYNTAEVHSSGSRS